MHIKRVQKHWFQVLAPIVVLGAVLMADRHDFFRSGENLTVDMRFKHRAESDPPAHPDLLLVGIDEPSISTFGKWPWSREIHGQFMELLAMSNPSVVTFDIFFPDPSADPAADQALIKGAMSLPKVITGAVSEKLAAPDVNYGLTQPVTEITGDTSRVSGTWSRKSASEAGDPKLAGTGMGALLPLPGLRDKSLFAFVNADPNGDDGIRRTLPMLCRMGTKFFLSLSAQTVVSHLSAEKVRFHLAKSASYMELQLPGGKLKRVALNEAGEMLINYRSELTFTVLPYAGLVAQLAAQHLQNQSWDAAWPRVDNKILIIGQTAAGLTDFGPSPYKGLSASMLVHAGAVDNILKEDYLYQLPRGYVSTAWLVLAYATLLLLRKAQARWAVTVPLLLIAAYAYFAFFVMKRHSILLPIFWPTLSFALIHVGAVVLRWVEEESSKRALKTIFGSYISPRVMGEILRNPSNLRMGGERKMVAIFFSDIRGFTSLSERMLEEDLVKQLNEYFERMVQCVDDHQGTLHKYIGDAIMAVWGDVIAITPRAAAESAILTALGMRPELAALNERWESEGRPRISIGIGVNLGEVIVGNIGAERRKEFTVIGDAVNLASRLESLTKEFHTDLLIGESLYAVIDKERFHTRCVGLVTVKGKTIPVRVYEVLAEATPANRAEYEWVKVFNRAFEMRLKRQHTAARSLFLDVLRICPGDYVTNEYCNECVEPVENLPGETVDGVLIGPPHSSDNNP